MSDISTPTVYIGFITFGALTAPYLPIFLESIARQTFKDYKLVAYDNTPTKEADFLNTIPDSVDVFKSSQNIGFSRAFNKLIAEAKNNGAKYFLVINPDIYLDPTALDILVKTLEADNNLGSVCPKILKWDFKANQLTNIIDSCGMIMHRGLAFSDLGQGLVDHNQFDKTAIIGPSGAAGLFRLSALDTIAEDGKYFDENFFMYKEDCDLSYRFYLHGFKSQLVPQAKIYHDRTVTGGNLWDRFINRRKRSVDVRRWSFTNQHFLFIKYWSKQNFFNRLVILIRVKLLFLNALLFEQDLLTCYSIIFKEKSKLKRY